MKSKEIDSVLTNLLADQCEHEVVEFKEAKSNFDFNKIGKYFSALSNEASLRNKDWAWLVFGIQDGTHRIVGTKYRAEQSSLNSLKHEIAKQTTGQITFHNIHELKKQQGRVLIFQIPRAPKGMPIAWKGHWYGRDGESLVSLNIQEIEHIRSQGQTCDWSAKKIADAKLADLDKEAILKAREQYKIKNPHLSTEIDEWNDAVFLNKARLTIGNTITTTAVMLLGKPESVHFLSPAQAQITWILKDESNVEKGYKHFGPPFILNVEKVYSKIRNLEYRYMKDGTLFPIEITKYDPWVVREALHNCIAHQDYSLGGRINVIEKPDQLIFSNLGSFIPGNIETVIKQDAPTEVYRNPFLALAMVQLNMIDTIGSGIKKMFETQRNRFFPLPDYDLSSPEKVLVRIAGKIFDENYTRLLMKKTDLDLYTVMLLDKVQRNIKLTKPQHRFLKSRLLVEGRYPNIYVSAHIAAASGSKGQYIKNQFDDRYYSDMILKFLKKYKSAKRSDIDGLLFDKLPDVLNDKKKKTKIGNLLSRLRMSGKIENTGSSRHPHWVLSRT